MKYFATEKKLDVGTKVQIVDINWGIFKSSENYLLQEKLRNLVGISGFFVINNA